MHIFHFFNLCHVSKQLGIISTNQRDIVVSHLSLRVSEIKASRWNAKGRACSHSWANGPTTSRASLSIREKYSGHCTFYLEANMLTCGWSNPAQIRVTSCGCWVPVDSSSQNVSSSQWQQMNAAPNGQFKRQHVQGSMWQLKATLAISSASWLK